MARCPHPENACAGHASPETDDELNLAYLPPPGTHSSRAYYANADERIQNALAHVNPARGHLPPQDPPNQNGAHAGQEALMRALTAERQHHRAAARYWLDVYGELVG